MIQPAVAESPLSRPACQSEDFEPVANAPASAGSPTRRTTCTHAIWNSGSCGPPGTARPSPRRLLGESYSEPLTSFQKAT